MRPFAGLEGSQPAWERLEIHRALPDPFHRQAQEANFALLVPHLPGETRLTLVLWPRLLDHDNMHARCLLTERGGMGFDWGLDEGTNPHQTTEVRLKERERFTELRAQSHPESRYFGNPEILQLPVLT